MVNDILSKIVDDKKQEIAAAKQHIPESILREKAFAPRKKRPFLKILEQPGPFGVNIIAEIKRASPSKGDIRANLNPAVYAHEYEKGGAAALSVLTDQPYFKGCSEDLKIARQTTTLPIPLANWHDFGWSTSYLADDNSGVGDGNDVETWADGQVAGADLTTPGNAPSYDADGCPNSTPAVDFLDNEYLENATLHCADGNNRCTVVMIGRWSGTPVKAALCGCSTGIHDRCLKPL